MTSTIPAAIRRKVFHRDHFACVTPGCRATRHLDLHHVRHREEGGGHSMLNVCVLCFGCHQRHHEGRLMITGRAPDHLQFTWKHDDDVESAMSGPSWDWVPGDADGTQEAAPAPDRRPDDRASARRSGRTATTPMIFTAERSQRSTPGSRTFLPASSGAGSRSRSTFGRSSEHRRRAACSAGWTSGSLARDVAGSNGTTSVLKRCERATTSTRRLPMNHNT